MSDSGFLNNIADRARFGIALTRKRHYVLLISHMRSYSSLLGHILGSHPQIDGYSESHLSYAHDLALIELALKTYHTNGRQLRGDILFDKVLHGHHEIADKIIRRGDVSLIFALREPLASVKSTVMMARRNKKPDWKGDVERVSAYYQRRVSQMVELARRDHNRSAFLHADHLIDRTDDVLLNLTSYLDLRQPLTSTYETFEYTGTPIFGDPGKYIASGHIVRERDSHSAIEIEASLVKELERSFVEGSYQLKDLCQVTL